MKLKMHRVSPGLYEDRKHGIILRKCKAGDIYAGDWCMTIKDDSPYIFYGRDGYSKSLGTASTVDNIESLGAIRRKNWERNVQKKVDLLLQEDLLTHFDSLDFGCMGRRFIDPRDYDVPFDHIEWN